MSLTYEQITEKTTAFVKHLMECGDNVSHESALEQEAKQRLWQHFQVSAESALEHWYVLVKDINHEQMINDSIKLGATVGTTPPHELYRQKYPYPVKSDK